MGHTLGPWKDTEIIGNPIKRRVYAENSHEIAFVFAAGGDVAANARLIASAPDLLAALKAATDDVDTLRENMRHGLYDAALSLIPQMLERISATVTKAEAPAPER